MSGGKRPRNSDRPSNRSSSDSRLRFTGSRANRVACEKPSRQHLHPAAKVRLHGSMQPLPPPRWVLELNNCPPWPSAETARVKGSRVSRAYYAGIGSCCVDLPAAAKTGRDGFKLLLGDVRIRWQREMHRLHVALVDLDRHRLGNGNAQFPADVVFGSASNCSLKSESSADFSTICCSISSPLLIATLLRTCTKPCIKHHANCSRRYHYRVGKRNNPKCITLKFTGRPIGRVHSKPRYNTRRPLPDLCKCSLATITPRDGLAAKARRGAASSVL